MSGKNLVLEILDRKDPKLIKSGPKVGLELFLSRLSLFYGISYFPSYLGQSEGVKYQI